MLAIVSDLRFTDGSLGPSPTAAALQRFAVRLGEMAARASMAAGGGCRAIESVDLLLLGDTLDLIGSGLWLDHVERPWHDPHDPEVFDLIARIAERILAHNAAAFEILRAMSDGAAFPRPVSLRIHYMVGDRDWPLHLLGPQYDRLRSLVASQLGLAARADVPFPHDPAESEPIVDLLRRHRIVARHGDIYDPIHFDEDRRASSLGDAIAIETLGRFQRDIQIGFGDDLSAECRAELAELCEHRPLILAPSRIEAWLERTRLPAARQRATKMLWDRLVERFVELPFVRSRRAWNPVDLADGLLGILKFRRRAGLASHLVMGHEPELKFAGRPASPLVERIPGSAATWPNFLVVFAAEECSDRAYEIGSADLASARLESRAA